MLLMLTTWPWRLATMPGKKADGDAQAAEVVELHGALVVVKTVVAGLDGAANGAARVVDQKVNAAMCLGDLRHKVSAGFGLGNVHRIGHKLVAARLGLGTGLIELVLVAPANEGDGAGLGKLVRRRQADAGRAAGDQHHLAPHGAAQAAVDVQVGVEVALPVVPQAPGVIVQIGAFDTGALERGQRVAAVKARGVVDKGQHVFGQPRSFMMAARTRRTGASAIRALVTLRGMKPNSAALMNRFILGACAALLKMSSTSPTR